MQEQLHYFKLLQHKGVETDLRSQKNIKLGTIDYWITLKCEFCNKYKNGMKTTESQ